MLIRQWWKVLEDGRCLTKEEHFAEYREVGHPIKVTGLKWQTDDATQQVFFKDYAPYVPTVSLLKDKSGFIVTEPRELAGDDCVVVINADGTERYRLKGTLPAGMFPPYMDGGKLVMHENSREHDGFAAMFEDAGGTRIVEFDQETGQYTGKFLSIRY